MKQPTVLDRAYMKARMEYCKEKKDIDGLTQLMNDCLYRARAARDIGWPALADSWQADADHLQRIIESIKGAKS